MSGYLQRLAASAARPRETVHPFVGSIFQAPAQDHTAEIQSTHATLSVPHSHDHASEPTLVSRPGHLRPIAPSSIEIRSNPTTPLADTTLQPMLASQPLRTEDSAFEPTTIPSEEIRPEAHPEKQLTERLIVERPSLPDAGNDLARLLLEIQPLSPPSRAQQRPAPATPRVTASIRETDEISIHIGRIEVTAIQQPIARPAPPPARRAVSLDDYLKRRDGRAG